MKDKIKRFTKKYLNIKYIMPFVLIFSLSFAMLGVASADYVTVTSTADRFSIDDYGNNFDFPITSTSASLSSKFYSYSYSKWGGSIDPSPFYFYIYFPRSFPSSSACGVDLNFWYVSCDPDGSNSQYLTSATPFYYQLGYYSESSDGNEVNFEWVTNSVSFPDKSLNVVADAANNGYPASGLGWISPYSYNSFHGSFTSSEEFNVIRIGFNVGSTRTVASFCFNQCVIQSTYFDDGAGGETSSDTSSDTDTDTDTDSGSGGTGGGDTSSGGGGSINWPETDQPEVDNGLNDANSGLHDVENELNSAFDDVYSDVDLDIDNVITDDILSSTYFFSQMLGTCFDGLPWLNTLVTVSLVIGGIGVLLGFFKRSG